MAEVSEEKLKEVQHKIRDLINWIEVWNLEEVEGGVKKIEDDVVEELKQKLAELSQAVDNLVPL